MNSEQYFAKEANCLQIWLANRQNVLENSCCLQISISQVMTSFNQYSISHTFFNLFFFEMAVVKRATRYASCHVNIHTKLPKQISSDQKCRSMVVSNRCRICRICRTFNSIGQKNCKLTFTWAFFKTNSMFRFDIPKIKRIPQN